MAEKSFEDHEQIREHLVALRSPVWRIPASGFLLALIRDLKLVQLVSAVAPPRPSGPFHPPPHPRLVPVPSLLGVPAIPFALFPCFLALIPSPKKPASHKPSILLARVCRFYGPRFRSPMEQRALCLRFLFNSCDPLHVVDEIMFLNSSVTVEV
jgi:hypothetical protein